MIPVGIELHADAPAGEVDASKRFDHAAARRDGGLHIGVEAELAKGADGLGAARNLAGLRERGDEVRPELDPVGERREPSQPFAGQENEIVRRLRDEARQPCLGRPWVGEVLDRHEGAEHRLRAALAQHAGEQIRFPRLGDDDAAAGQRPAHDVGFRSP